MIWPVFRKDWILLWPFAVLVVLIQVVLEWANFRFGFFGVSSVARELMGLLTPAWYLGTMALAVAVVQEDTIPGVDQDWLIRPLVRTDLLLAKMLFVLVAIGLPMLAVNLVDELVSGFAFGPSFGGALYKELYLFLTLWLPAMALASASRNMTDLVVLVAALVVLYAAVLWAAAMLFGVDRCPTCDTSVAWLQHQLQHGGVLVGAVAVLALQYYKRDTRSSRIVLAAGVAGLVIVQLPWNAAFAIQSWLSVPIGTAPASIRIEADSTRASDPQTAHRVAKRGSARQATRALLQGDVDSAVSSLGSNPQDPPVTLSVPLRVAGLGPDEFLAVDHAVYSLLDAKGAVLYSDAAAERKAQPLVPDPSTPGSLEQKFEVPGSVYERLAGRAVSLSIDFSLTVRAVVAQHRIRASDGVLRSPEIGMCRSHADRDAASIRCKQIGHTPNCYSATLYSADGRHNPEVYTCGSDYRPFIPSRTNIINLVGVNLPINDPYGIAHYQVDSSNVADAYAILKVYETGAHFRRTVVSAFQAPAAD